MIAGLLKVLLLLVNISSSTALIDEFNCIRVDNVIPDF